MSKIRSFQRTRRPLRTKEETQKWRQEQSKSIQEHIFTRQKKIEEERVHQEKRLREKIAHAEQFIAHWERVPLTQVSPELLQQILMTRENIQQYKHELHLLGRGDRQVVFQHWVERIKKPLVPPLLSITPTPPPPPLTPLDTSCSSATEIAFQEMTASDALLLHSDQEDEFLSTLPPPQTPTPTITAAAAASPAVWMEHGSGRMAATRDLNHILQMTAPCHTTRSDETCAQCGQIILVSPNEGLFVCTTCGATQIDVVDSLAERAAQSNHLTHFPAGNNEEKRHRAPIAIDSAVQSFFQCFAGASTNTSHDLHSHVTENQVEQACQKRRMTQPRDDSVWTVRDLSEQTDSPQVLALAQCLNGVAFPVLSEEARKRALNQAAQSKRLTPNHKRPRQSLTEAARKPAIALISLLQREKLESCVPFVGMCYPKFTPSVTHKKGNKCPPLNSS